MDFRKCLSSKVQNDKTFLMLGVKRPSRMVEDDRGSDLYPVSYEKPLQNGGE